MQASDGQSWPALVDRAFGGTAFGGLRWAGAWEREISPMLTDAPGRLAATGGLFEPPGGTGGLLAAARDRADLLGAVAGMAGGPVPAQGILALEVRTAWIMAIPALVLLGVDNPATVHAMALTPAGLTNQRTGQHALARVLKLLGPWPLLQAMSVPPAA
ncbi:MAG: hypothetical protein RLP08_09230 [Marinovum algicola]|uniref:hypothetical protein n=1 Tax=Marinovum algicola TaxID=42444 RepID=UPI0032F077F9